MKKSDEELFDLVIKNGLVVTPEAISKLDIGITGEKIVALAEPGIFRNSKEYYDAEGKIVLPGLIDPHVHMHHPFQSEFSADGFYSTTVSAIFGGVTSIIDFAIQWNKAISLPDTIKNRRDQILSETLIDFGLHGVPTISDQSTLEAVIEARELGVSSFKVYMVYRQQGRMIEDPILYGLLQELKKVDGLLMVHAENVSMSEYNQALFISKDQTDASFFPKYKPNIVEAEAINRALFFNKLADSKLFIVHLSTREGLELLKKAHLENERSFAETCTHYLTLSDEVYKLPNGHDFICSPPLRSKVDIDALWGAIADGSILIVSSDHCGFDLRQKMLGQGKFFMTPNGLPGIEARLPVLFTKGVIEGRISINKLVEVSCTNVAKMFGLYPQKGVIKPGSDADLVIIDEKDERIFGKQDLHGAVDWTPYEGMLLQGFAQTTILRGQFLMKNRVLMAKRGFGKFLFR